MRKKRSMKCEQKIAIVVFFTAYSNRLSLFLIKWFYSRFVTEIQNYYKHTNPKIYVYFIIVSSRNFSVVGHIKFCVCDEEEKKYLRLYYEESCSTRIYMSWVEEKKCHLIIANENRFFGKNDKGILCKYAVALKYILKNQNQPLKSFKSKKNQI